MIKQFFEFQIEAFDFLEERWESGPVSKTISLSTASSCFIPC